MLGKFETVDRKWFSRQFFLTMIAYILHLKNVIWSVVIDALIAIDLLLF